MAVPRLLFNNVMFLFILALSIWIAFGSGGSRILARSSTGGLLFHDIPDGLGNWDHIAVGCLSSGDKASPLDSDQIVLAFRS
jgi:hypothetical protein